MLERREKRPSNIILLPSDKGSDRFTFNNYWGRFIVGGAIGYTLSGLSIDASVTIASKIIEISAGSLKPQDFAWIGNLELDFAMPCKIITGLVAGSVASCLPRSTKALLEVTQQSFSSMLRKGSRDFPTS